MANRQPSKNRRRNFLLVILLGIFTTCGLCFCTVQMGDDDNEAAVEEGAEDVPSVTPSDVPGLRETATRTRVPTAIPNDTATPRPTATNRPTERATVPLLPSATSGPVCDCSGDTLNCTDFNRRSAAQACHDYCIAQGAGDIHGLDADGNGAVCETMP